MEKKRFVRGNAVENKQIGEKTACENHSTTSTFAAQRSTFPYLHFTGFFFRQRGKLSEQGIKQLQFAARKNYIFYSDAASEHVLCNEHVRVVSQMEVRSEESEI